VFSVFLLSGFDRQFQASAEREIGWNPFNSKLVLEIAVISAYFARNSTSTNEPIWTFFRISFRQVYEALHPSRKAMLRMSQFSARQSSKSGETNCLTTGRQIEIIERNV
jgi:hypothetical protein